MDQVLQEGGLLQIRAVGKEGEGWRGAVIKPGWIGDDVSEILVQESVVRFYSEFKFVAAMNRGDRALEISFVEEIVLKNLDGRGIWIRVEIVGVIANHAAQIGHYIPRKDMLVGNDPYRFDVVR